MHAHNAVNRMSARWRSVLSLVVLLLALFLFLKSGLRDDVSVENLRALGDNPLTPVLIILAMTGAWTFALPGSVFFFITPLLFEPLTATAIICAGSLTGTVCGYSAARYVGGPWVEAYRQARMTRFLDRHSSFGILFALRIVPGAQHGLINYSAGLLHVPLGRFLTATMVSIAIKAFLYATALQGSVSALNVRDALNWQTVAALFGLAALGVGGHLWERRWRRETGSEERNSV